MKSRNLFTVAATVAVVILSVTFMFREAEPVKAQDELPPPTNDRISFGSVGLTSGQTLRVNVTNTIMPSDINLPPGPVRVAVTFRYQNGSIVRNARTGEAIRKIVDLERGDSAFIDVDYGDLPPGPTRAQMRAVVVGQQPPPVPDSGQNPIPPGSVIATAEIINNANGRTQYALFTHPAAVRGFNPQPDPPSPEGQ